MDESEFFSCKRSRRIMGFFCRILRIKREKIIKWKDLKGIYDKENKRKYQAIKDGM